MSLLDIFKKKKKNKEKVPKEERLDKLWNLWSERDIDSPYNELMKYQAEVNNGGHDQYFLNVTANKDIKKELKALNEILPEELEKNLQKAHKAYLKLEKKKKKKKKDDEKNNETLEKCDNIFYAHQLEINEILEEHAKNLGL